MTKKLFFQALMKFVVGLAIVMALLFIPAGTLSYWQAWLFIGILFIPMLIVGKGEGEENEITDLRL